MATATSNQAWTIPSLASKVTDLTKRIKPVPAPGPKQVLVKMMAASLNFRDILISTRSPAYPGIHKPDLVPGSDGAGIIYTLGPSSIWAGREGTPVLLHCSSWLVGDVRNLRGDAVFGGTDVDGTLQEWMVVDDEWIIEAPKNLSAVESASLVTAGTTAWAAIRGGVDGRLNGGLDEWKGDWTEKRLQGKTVLTMGTGGVSCFAIQIAAALGASVIATSSSDSKLDFAKSLGATHVINYSKIPDWDNEVLRITGGNGVDHVIETGGAGTLMKSVNSTRPGGLISLLGILTPNEAISAAFVPSVLFGAKIVKGCTAFSRDALAEFAKLVEANGIKPIIAQSFDFSQMIEAFQLLQKQNAVGKIVVKISDS
ncbi:NAD-P-binding protein [Periconia macrospinosa]|uniref:NAD-P-binding protein n=1 Tax=Periconia macrospinosa TaxID=97972 RepID=A0A2V1DV91_9PLEO|nr:NAD-P-binding protein [Periconia macrospinosa]